MGKKKKPANFDIEKHTIFLGVYGSHAYGTSTPESDVDLRGILIQPKRLLMSPFEEEFEQHEEKPEKDDADVVIYELKKFVGLAVRANPSIFDLLYLPEDCIRTLTPFAEMLLDIRDAFLSIRAQETYIGYAVSQLQRIKRHRGWLLDPPKKKPERSDFGLTDKQVDFDALKKAQQKVRDLGGDPMKVFGPEMDAERRYQTALKHWQSYQQWARSRNPARKELEARWGYDTKHAMHLIRLLRMGWELVTTGQVNVRRPDAEELLAIRTQGIWAYERLEEYLEEMTAKVDSFTGSPLPAVPDIKRIEERTIEIMERFWAHNGS